jgi:hypothetical protein
MGGSHGVERETAITTDEAALAKERRETGELRRREITRKHLPSKIVWNLRVLRWRCFGL